MVYAIGYVAILFPHEALCSMIPYRNDLFKNNIVIYKSKTASTAISRSFGSHHFFLIKKLIEQISNP